jgi:hypothetical protein
MQALRIWLVRQHDQHDHLPHLPSRHLQVRTPRGTPPRPWTHDDGGTRLSVKAEGLDTAGPWNCTSCPPGFFQPLVGQQVCLPCKEGSYNPKYTRARTLDSQTLSGAVRRSFGMSRCTFCEAGRYQPDTNQTTCPVCELGYYNDKSTGAEPARRCAPAPCRRDRRPTSIYLVCRSDGMRGVPCRALHEHPPGEQLHHLHRGRVSGARAVARWP